MVIHERKGVLMMQKVILGAFVLILSLLFLAGSYEKLYGQ